MATISTALICRNEEKNLPRWLESVKGFSDQIVAVDSGSDDASMDILRAAGAEVYSHPWQGYAKQRNTAASYCTGDWVLYLDADEFVDAELAAGLNALKDSVPDKSGFELAYKNYFFGRFMRHGGYFPEHHLRIARRDAGRWVREIHERLEVEGEVGRLEGFVHHHSYDSVGDYLRRMDVYSELGAKHLAAKGRKASAFSAFSHAFWCFFYRYFIRLGMLDGFEGYTAARLEAMYTFAKYARLRETRK